MVSAGVGGWPVSVYKPCDIRGAVEDLSQDLYRAWGQVLAGALPPGAVFPVGGDVRTSSPAFREAFLDGARRAGAQAVDLGTVPTPMVWFARRHLGAPAAAMVTASHSPPAINGLKWMVGDLPPSEAQVQALRAATEGGEAPQRAGGSLEALDVTPAYCAWLQQRWGGATASLAVAAKVILDPGNGCWAGLASPCLHAAFPAARIGVIHDTRDGLFRERDPDSARPQHLRALTAAVRRQGADLGIAFDGDGDRVACVDGGGQVLTSEQTAWILAHSFGREWEGRVFVYDLKSSRRLVRAVEALGGCPVAQRSGHAFIRTQMVRDRALFGAEISGHTFFDELQGGDDGLFAACRILWWLAASGRSLAAWRGACPPMFTTPDLRVPVAATEAEAVLARLEAAFADRPRSDLDGVRVELPSGWALARRSVTAPELTFRFEGDSATDLAAIVADVAGRLGEVGARLWARYQQEFQQARDAGRDERC